MWRDNDDYDFFDDEREEEYENKVKNHCCYCRQEEIHPAYKEHDLCSCCASELFEDFQETIAKYEHSLRLARQNIK